MPDPIAKTAAYSPAMETVRLEVEDGVATMRVDRPTLNALDLSIQVRLAELAAECAGRSDIAAVVVTGGDQVFAAGADIKQLLAMSAAEMREHSAVLQGAFAAVARIPQPVVAAINGYALGGGCELALCADVRFAATDAQLGQPEIKLGIIPGAGGTQRLTRLVGPSRAKDLILTGRVIEADEALAIGLVDRVLPPDQVQSAAYAWARQFVGGPAVALRATKRCIDDGIGLELDAGLELERAAFAELFDTEDRLIGMQAFVEKRLPDFTGR